MFLLLASLAVMAMGPVTGQELDCNTDEFRIIPKANCRGYYICFFRQPIEMPDCPKELVFSQFAHVCVPTDSMYNDCQTTTSTVGPDIDSLSIEDKCQLFGGVYPHPYECQLFYNCSKTYTESLYFSENYTQECTYPDLFSTETNQCEDFEQVTCGNRAEYTNACSYKRNACPRSHCIPCYVLYPNCDGKPDGINAFDAKLWSPYYAVCKKSRAVSQETCKMAAGGHVQLFHPIMNKCVSLDLIPQEFGGMMPNCTGLPDGANADEFGRCNQYTECLDGVFVRNNQCAHGQLFDSLYRNCTEADKTCGPCGYRVDC